MSKIKRVGLVLIGLMVLGTVFLTSCVGTQQDYTDNILLEQVNSTTVVILPDSKEMNNESNGYQIKAAAEIISQLDIKVGVKSFSGSYDDYGSYRCVVLLEKPATVFLQHMTVVITQ